MNEHIQSDVHVALDNLEAKLLKLRQANAPAKARNAKLEAVGALDAALSEANDVRAHAYALTVENGTLKDRARLSPMLTMRVMRKG
jgi:hypothetical protein